jgi:hypothetical protein
MKTYELIIPCKSGYEMPKNSAFNAQGSRVIIVVIQVRGSENICSSSAGAREKRKHTG